MPQPQLKKKADSVAETRKRLGVLYPLMRILEYRGFTCGVQPHYGNRLSPFTRGGNATLYNDRWEPSDGAVEAHFAFARGEDWEIIRGRSHDVLFPASSGVETILSESGLAMICAFG